MTITNYFELTSSLIYNFIGSLYPTGNQYDQEVATSSQQLNQYNLIDKQDNNKVLLVTNISELSPKSSLINLIYDNNESQNKTIDNLLIDWDDSDLTNHPVSFPIGELNLPNDLIQAFNRKVKSLAVCSKLDAYFSKECSRLSELSAVPERPHSHPDPLKNEADLLDTALPKSSLISDPPVSHRPNDMPDFEDELEIRGSARSSSQPSGFPLVGDSDLNPPGLPKHPEMKPYIDPLRSGGSGDGGMYPTPDHPLFGGRQEGGNTSRLGVPPGARFDDPYGEDNLDALGSGLPGNLRGGGFGSVVDSLFSVKQRKH
ncbi:PI31 proteasome regulator-domain-containing protein [Scheffersomyces xylosifermentans]|uniref:PI31 proteasome regulator-domain-containing protein n=1 Tax=Scheffersomyces xylosifermentans TaxID=1304137 RepID=UPI00315CD907